jgi:hypothetical protein
MRDVRDIRQGMLDAFFGRKTPQAWRLNPRCRSRTRRRRPRRDRPGDRSRRRWGAQHRRRVVDVDEKTPTATTRISCIRRGRTCAIVAHKWVSKPFVHPTKKQGGKARQYTIDLPPEQWPTIFHRVPGLHLQNRQISLDGEQVPAIIPALLMHAVNNYDTQKAHGSGVYYYVPKIETWQEARLSRNPEGRRSVGLTRGSLKIKCSAARRHALQQEAIMWVLRENLIGRRRPLTIEQPRECSITIPRWSLRSNTVTLTEPSLTCTMRTRCWRSGRQDADWRHGGKCRPEAPENDQGAARHLVRQAASGSRTIRINGRITAYRQAGWRRLRRPT